MLRSQRSSDRVRPRSWRALVLALAVSSPFACRSQGGSGSPIPPAEAYDAPSQFAGVWDGEVDGAIGTLRVSPLGDGRYRGLYRADDGRAQYVLLLEQDEVSVGDDTMLGNRTLFTWQDGNGARGEGWMLINRNASALTGALGEQGHMDRSLTFIVRDG